MESAVRGFICTLGRTRAQEHPATSWAIRWLRRPMPFSTMALPSGMQSPLPPYISPTRSSREDYIREPGLQLYPIPGPPTLPSFPLSVSPLSEFSSSPRLLSTLLFLFLRIAKQGESGGGLGSDMGDVSQFKKSVSVTVPGPISQCHDESGVKGSGWGSAIGTSTASPGGFSQLTQFPVTYVHTEVFSSFSHCLLRGV